MKSYKCLQCGLTNWVTDEFCKRCQIPNPHLDQNFQPGSFDAVNSQNYAVAGSYGQTSIPDYSTPPPPNVFGNAAGTASASDNFNDRNSTYGNRPPIRSANNFQSPEITDKLAQAEKQIRNAWISGLIVCIITTIIALIVSAAGAENSFVPATPFEMLFSVVIFGGLTIGVYYKNRGCAIALCILFVVDKIITFAATGKFGGGILAFVFIYYFIYGIQGTFTYHKLKKQNF